jgi:hypothetical protein
MLAQRLALISQCLFISLCWFGLTAAYAQVHHQLEVTLDPTANRLEVTDQIRVETSRRQVSLLLHSGLNPQIRSTGATMTTMPADRGSAVPLQQLDIELMPGVHQFTLQYAGTIHHPITPSGAEYARSFNMSPGLITVDGVFLSGASYWVAQAADQLFTFELTVTLPSGWLSMSQGERVRHDEGAQVRDTWSIDKPQQELYLIAGPFAAYRDTAGAVEAWVLLRTPDPTLARKYLEVTPPYISLYDRLIGPYPYTKFALVENFWETGYGMPSFTLLGPRVIRLPFILHSSYPHEILHNWWGNSVYVDVKGGNWAEGLTSYLADHLIKEQRGQGVDYRRQALQKYTDYVRDQKDFPLTAFQSRHSSVTEAVGYGKTLMLFHMLRLQLGDARFADGLRRLYQQYQFKLTSFRDVAQVFNQVSEQPLMPFFEQWVERTGAPQLRLSAVDTTPLNNGYRLSGVLEQIQDAAPYDLSVPIAVQMEGQSKAYQHQLRVRDRRDRFELKLPAPPVRLEVDPEFDVFRRLDRHEIPPALTQAFGARRALMVLPAAAPESMQSAYRQLAAAWSQGDDTAIEIKRDRDLANLPSDRAVWLLGWDNRFRSALSDAVSNYPVTFAPESVTLEGQRLDRSTHSVVVVARHPANPDDALTWIATDHAAAMPGLGRKLSHYGKYSYLGFTGDEPDNVLKGVWPVVGSPLSVTVQPSDCQATATPKSPLAPRSALASLPPVFSAERMMHDIAFLASPEMAGRGLGSRELERAADYIAEQFRQAGLQGGVDHGRYRQTWTVDIDGLGSGVALTNVIGVRPGTNPAYRGQCVVLGAHYDHLGRGWPDVRAGNAGQIHPGADDNASGVAVLLELARVLHDWQPERTVIWVAFTGEEAGKLGSQYYLRHADEHGDAAKDVIGMLNLDAVGRLGDQPLMILGTASAREWVHIFQGAGYVTGVTVRAVADDLGSSDQARFIEQGIPAVQVFSGAHADYHRPSDTVDKIDADGLVKVAAVVKEALEYLASRPDRLNVTLPGQQESAPSSTSGRRVMLGTVPDFAFDGTGVRLSGVTADTPAARAGLQPGDIIVSLNNEAVQDLRAYAKLLKALQPGDPVTIKFLRQGREQRATATLTAR